MPWAVPGMDVTLEQNCDDWHGFLRLDVTAGTIRGRYRSVPRPQESWRAGPVTLVDDFTLDLGRHTVG